MKCILCNSSKTSLKYHKNNYQYYLCAYCNSLFIGNTPSQSTLKRYYEQNFKYSYNSETKEIISHEARNSLHRLLGLNKEGTKLLDVGVGNGEFIEEALKLGMTCKGIEPSKDLHGKLNNQIRKRVDNCDIEEFLRKDTSKYDFISLIHVIEHLAKPQELIIELWNRLNRDGILLIETPNLGSWLYKIEGPEYTFLTPPDHICLFSPKSFQYISKRIRDGTLSKLKIETYSYSSHILGSIRGLVNSRNRNHQNVLTQVPLEDSLETTNVKSIKRIIGMILSKLLGPIYNVNHHGSILRGYFIRT